MKEHTRYAKQSYQNLLDNRVVIHMGETFAHCPKEKWFPFPQPLVEKHTSEFKGKACHTPNTKWFTYMQQNIQEVNSKTNLIHQYSLGTIAIQF